MDEIKTPSSAPQQAALLKNKKRTNGLSVAASLAIIFFLIAIVALAGLWFQEKKFERVGREIATQFQLATTQIRDARRDSAQALSLAQSQVSRLAQLDQSHQEAKSQIVALEQVLASANKGTEDAILANDIERLLTTAHQQLRLAGSVSNAIVTLEAAQSLLNRADRARFAAVQRAINVDLDRLRVVPSVDIAQLSSRLETLSGLIARAPLLLPDAAAPKVAGAPLVIQPLHSDFSHSQRSIDAQPTAASAQPWWESALNRVLSGTRTFAAMIVREFAEVVSIQRVSDTSALLMSPEQGTLLRAHLRSRMLTAQMALLMRQTSVWITELTQVEQSLMTRYDLKAGETLAALRLVKELISTPISLALPDIKDSLIALESVRAAEPASVGGQ